MAYVIYMPFLYRQCETKYNTTTVQPKVIELGPKLEVCVLLGKTPIRPIGQMISAHVLGDEIELVECGIKESCVPFGPLDSYNLKDLSPALGYVQHISFKSLHSCGQPHKFISFVVVVLI